MEWTPASALGRSFASRRGWVLTLGGAAIALAALSLAVVVAQVEVADGGLGVTRTCGSVFDGVADRSGWEVWWARDLDEPDDAVRAALLRTTECPAAINRRIALAGALGVVAGVLALAAARLRSERRVSPTAGAGERIGRLGRWTSSLGGGLTVAGVVAVVLLVADADSTLFLYTDRLVVAVVGLIVLVPAAALFVLGRALVLLARCADEPDVGTDLDG